MALTPSASWHWYFDQPPEVIWSIFSDTARFNEAAGFPLHTITEQQQADGSVRYFGRGKIGSYVLEWEEIPTNWSEYLWFTHQRRFSKGPFTHITSRVSVEATDTGCICHYELQAEPANLLGRFLLLTGFFRNTGEKFTAMAEQARRFTRGESPQPFSFAPPVLVPGGKARALQLREELALSPYTHQLQDKLVHWIVEQPEVDVWTIRPKALAKRWDQPARYVTELCLAAVDAGLLSMRWDLLCPNCRVGKTSSTRMDEIPQGTHCHSCNIDYQRNFSRNVELAFFPSKSIRPLSAGEYCLFGPGSTPHIQVQLRVEPDSRRIEDHALKAGFYRIRTLEPGNEVSLDWAGFSFPALVFDADDQLRLGEPGKDAGKLALHNQSHRARTLIIEYQAWKQDVLSAHEASTLQCFRELFSEQILRPGDMVEIDNVALMFTDIKGSTALYNRVGDAAAYALVREHFAILAACVREHGGSIVKTIGDAIMAAFVVPVDAVACSIAIQDAFATFNQQHGREEKVVVKLGMHMGPCISLTLNGVLDYYGKVANLTARIESLSEGGDVVLSKVLVEDPSVVALLQGTPVQGGVTRLKGFADDIPFFRLTETALSALVEKQHGAKQKTAE